MFDWTINLGHIISLILMTSTLVAGYLAVKTDIRLMSERMLTLGGRMINLETELKELAKVTVAMAATNERISAIGERFTDLTMRLHELERKVNDWTINERLKERNIS